jgi:thiosulfate/3-mercaptopyruvate sulfurtransferase
VTAVQSSSQISCCQAPIVIIGSIVKVMPGSITTVARGAITDPGQQIWDVRSAEEYRGERSGARRAGHIPTALNLDWMRLKDPTRQLRLVEGLEGLLRNHGIDRDKRVITHCQSHHRSGLSYLVGRLLGFRDIRAFHGSWAEWGNRDDTPVVAGSEPGRADGASP